MIGKPGVLQSMGHKESDMTERLNNNKVVQWVINVATNIFQEYLWSWNKKENLQISLQRKVQVAMVESSSTDLVSLRKQEIFYFKKRKKKKTNTLAQNYG